MRQNRPHFREQRSQFLNELEIEDEEVTGKKKLYEVRIVCSVFCDSLV